MFWNRLRLFGIIATLITLTVLMMATHQSPSEPEQTHAFNPVK